MTPTEETALELVNKFRRITDEKGLRVLKLEYAKQCALISVDEILDLNLGLSNCDENNWEIEEFYSEVKTEIQKLNYE
jgi:hypothetical protein